MLGFIRAPVLFVLCSSFSTIVLAAFAFDDVFEVAKGSVAGSCDSQLPLLSKMFSEIQKINTNTIAQLKTDKYNENAETRKLLKSMFGVNPSSEDKEPTDGLDLAKLKQVRSRLLSRLMLAEVSLVRLTNACCSLVPGCRIRNYERRRSCEETATILRQQFHDLHASRYCYTEYRW